MLKNFVTILFFICLTPYLCAQTLLPYKSKAPLAANLYWTKGFDYLESKRFVETLNLLEDLTGGNLGSCGNLQGYYDILQKAILEEDKVSAEKAFSEFIITGILIDIGQLNSIESDNERSLAIQMLFKELIAIQKYAKRLNFYTYRDLVISFRRLNQLVKNESQMSLYIENNPQIQKILEGC